jgi:hypothetical protein
MDEQIWETVAGEAWVEADIKVLQEWQELFERLVRGAMSLEPDLLNPALLARLDCLTEAPPEGSAADDDLLLVIALGAIVQRIVAGIYTFNKGGVRLGALQATGFLGGALIAAYAMGYTCAHDR